MATLIKDCRSVLSERDFKETRLNYWCLGGIHVEFRLVCNHEAWEIIDYVWDGPRQRKVISTGVGAHELEHQIEIKMRQHFPRRMFQ